MMTQWEERGHQRGLVEGREQERRELVRKQLEKRFGPLSPAALSKLQGMTAERLEEIALSYTEASSLTELGLGDD